MGIQLEMTSGRTLAFQGEKKVTAIVQSKNATTHSLTLQPLIAANGKLCLPILTIFYEPSGPPQCFEDDLRRYKNLRCFSTKSGKATTELMKIWMKEIFLPIAESNSVLLVDSWSGFNESKKLPEVKSKHISILTIPPKTTSVIQPCDVGFNRYFKSLHRTMEDKIRRMHPDFVVSKRTNIGRLLNQVVEQISAPRFSSLIQHSFIKPGYFCNRYEEYQTPDKYCFDFKKLGGQCEVQGCGMLAFIRCSWCEKLICFNDFILKLHCCREK